MLFVGYLVQNNRRPATVKSYVSAIRAVLQEVNVTLQEDRVLITALTRACRLRNDIINIRLPIQKGMLVLLLKEVNTIFAEQPYLKDLYRALLSTAYFGLFRVGELTAAPGAHQVLASDVHIGINKDKILFILRSSKTHGKSSSPQLIKITSSRQAQLKGWHQHLHLRPPCLFALLQTYLSARENSKSYNEPFFVFKNRVPVTAAQFRASLKRCLKSSGFDDKLYTSHCFRIGRSCDLYKCGVSIENIKKLGRWKSNAVFQYLRNC